MKLKKKLTIASDIKVGDTIYVGGIKGTIKKTQKVFFHAPNSSVRLSINLAGLTSKRDDVILFLPVGMDVYIWR